jgi:hypothetical protein
VIVPTVEVYATVPVTVIVDTDTEEVIEVSVADESIKWNRIPRSDIDARKARKMADEADWPEWTIG